MRNNIKTARIVGVLYLVTIITYHIGDYIIQSIDTAPNFLINISENSSQMVIGIFLELICGIAIFAIATMMYPVLKKINRNIALLYLGGRLIEFMIIIVSSISLFTLLRVSNDYTKAITPDIAHYQTISLLLEGTHYAAINIMMLFFGTGSILFYYLLYSSSLVPRFLSVWGIIASVLVVTETGLRYFGHSVGIGIFIYLPIGVNELFLATWLIIKGFNTSHILSQSTEIKIG